MKYLFTLALVIIAVLCYSELPQKISYQGVLTDNDNNPVADGSYTVDFSIHDNSGLRINEYRAQLWSETQTITVNNGQFRAILGSVNPLKLSFNEPYWLGITVNGYAMTPYSELTSVPFSFNSQNSGNAASLNGFGSSHYLDWDNFTNVPAGIHYSTFSANTSSSNEQSGFNSIGAPAISESPITGNVIRDNFQVSGQTHYSVIIGNVLSSGSNTFGSPQTNSLINNNIQ